MKVLEALFDAWRLFWDDVFGTFRATLDDTDPLDRLRALGADVEQRIRDATTLEAAGVPSDDVAIVAKIWASARLDVQTIHLMRVRGIDIQPVIDWVRRAIDREILLDRLMEALDMQDGE